MNPSADVRRATDDLFNALQTAVLLSTLFEQQLGGTPLESDARNLTRALARVATAAHDLGAWMREHGTENHERRTPPAGR